MLQIPVTIRDVTGRESDFTLDNCGFQYIDSPSQTSCPDDGYADEARLKAEYFPECEQILQSV
jgi:hypothetical protein